ncbi:cathepsin d [Plakobranchus ocellatus]|uniref:Cathepsin d n=1 Tax=Plakobranchus ocellatus TaxID=259542 RepID=A0AAV4D6J7_9GAST|nr:cathepsin d [Plakobranchus ocellatus]
MKRRALCIEYITFLFPLVSIPLAPVRPPTRHLNGMMRHHRRLIPHHGIPAEVEITNFKNVSYLAVKNQIFGEAMHQSEFFEEIEADGIMGMALEPASFFKQPSVFENMVEQNVVGAPVFAFYLDNPRTPSSDRGSMLTLGGTNPELYTRDFTYVNVTKPGYWQFQLDNVKVRTHARGVCRGVRQALVDSGTTLTVGPIRETDDLNLRLGARRIRFAPGMVNGLCISAFSGRTYRKDQVPYWVLGTSFMKAYYTKFDLGQKTIGFAKPRHYSYT